MKQHSDRKTVVISWNGEINYCFTESTMFPELFLKAETSEIKKSRLKTAFTDIGFDIFAEKNCAH